MNISYNWLNEYVDIADLTPQQLGEKLTEAGVPVEVFTPLNLGVKGVVVGHVVETRQHENADKLRVCTIDAGTGEHLQIVCGAPNVALGQKVPCAVVGSELPGDFKIKRAKLRGVESHGMLCSAKELGLDVKLLPKEQTEGLYILPADAEVGTPIDQYLFLNDTVMELELTPNRNDLLNYRGVAYEVAALLGRNVKMQEQFQAAGREATPVTVQLASENCTKYAAQVVQGVTIGESPLWLQAKLLANGVRPINNVVDVTNFVMLEIGQPLHAFDLAKVAERTIIVRQAVAGETHVTLDGVERTLDESMLVIADPQKVIGLAGVMGGENSEVDANTVDIVLESAFFDPSVTRRTGKKLGLFSEAQKRFEKGFLDRGMITNALLRAAQLIAELAGGQVVGAPVVACTAPVEPTVLELRLSRVNDVLGTEMSEQEMVDALTRLGFEVSGYKVDGAHRVTCPTRRPDMQREVDLIEEVGRIYGYNNIPATFMRGALNQGSLTDEQRLRRSVREVLINAGLAEVITYPFVAPNGLEAFGLHHDDMLKQQIPLMHPMSEERSVLRTHLLPSLIEVVHYNKNRKQHDLAIFEVGKVFHPVVGQVQPTELLYVAGVLTGQFGALGVGEKGRPADFFTLKGVLENLFDALGISGLTYTRAELPGMHPGRTALILQGGLALGYIAGLHPEVEEANELAPTYYFQLSLDALLQARNASTIVIPSLPKFPGSERDIAVLVDVTVPSGDLLATIRAAGGELLESVRIFDFYQGPQVPAGKKSLAYGLVYRSPERTLTDEEVTAAHANVTTALTEQHGAELRA